MPVITLECGKLTREQKSELVKEFTETASRITNIQKAAFVILLKENELENIGSGGELLADKLKA